MRTLLVVFVLLFPFFALAEDSEQGATKHDDTKAARKPDPILLKTEKALRSALAKVGNELSFEFPAHTRSLVVKYRIRKFMVHDRSKTGEVSVDAHERVGPSFRGFLLRAHVQKKGTVNQAVVPQTIREPYWQTDLDVVEVAGTDWQLYWALSYGTRTDKSLLRSVRNAITGLSNAEETKRVEKDIANFLKHLNAMPQNLVTTETSPETAGMRTVEVVRAVATAEAHITKRNVSHYSTVMGDIRGGGEVTHAYCRQSFSVLDVLAGEGKRGNREIGYGFVERAEGFPLPRPQSPIPKGAKVVLALGSHSHLLKVIPDTDKNRQTIGKITNCVKNRPPAAKALMAAMNSFSLKIEYHGPKPDLYYSVVCTTSRQKPRNLPPNWLVEQNVSHVWAYQALDHLVRTDVLDPKATRAEHNRSPAKEPFYSLTVSAEGTEEYTRNLDWGKQAYDSLEALAKAIQYDGGTMAKLLARLKESQ